MSTAIRGQPKQRHCATSYAKTVGVESIDFQALLATPEGEVIARLTVNCSPLKIRTMTQRVPTVKLRQESSPTTMVTKEDSRTNNGNLRKAIQPVEVSTAIPRRPKQRYCAYSYGEIPLIGIGVESTEFQILLGTATARSSQGSCQTSTGLAASSTSTVVAH